MHCIFLCQKEWNSREVWHTIGKISLHIDRLLKWDREIEQSTKEKDKGGKDATLAVSLDQKFTETPLILSHALY